MIKNQNNIVYSQFLSSLFSSVSITGLSVLCLLNNLSLDFYSTVFLLKVVMPAGICSWILGFVCGKILDSYRIKIKKNDEKDEQKAYEIPSMFLSEEFTGDEENNDLLNMGDL